MKQGVARLLAGTILAAVVHAAWAADAVPLRFDIRRFQVSGNTLLADADVAAALAPYTGAARDFGDVQRALTALTALYQARGYNVVTVRLPEQELAGGVVKLEVQQTPIGHVAVRGNRYTDEATVLRSVPALRVGETPNLSQISANVKLANQNPSRKVSLQLQSSDNDAAIDATLNVLDEQPWQGMVNLDNSGTGSTGKTHVTALLQYTNLWGRDHVGSLQYTTSAEEPGKVHVYGAGYHVPLYALGDAVDLFASYSNIDSGTVAAGVLNLAVSGRGAVYGARYNHTLAAQGQTAASLVYGVDYRGYKNSVLFANQSFGNDVTVHPLSFGYVATMPLADGDFNAALTLVHNVPGGDNGSSDDFARNRVGAKAAYNLVRFALAGTRTLARQWQLRLMLNGQLTSDALVPGEQFGAGGNASVRGFDERALSTDEGAFANAELYTPQLCGPTSRWQCGVLGFYDAAYGKRNHLLAGELSSTSIGSVGIGLRVGFGTSMNAQFDFGHVVRSGAVAGNDKNKLHVRVGLAY